jgi:hypothetical protein
MSSWENLQLDAAVATRSCSFTPRSARNAGANQSK